MTELSPFDRDLDRNAANFTALTPLSFLDRAAAVYPDRPAVIHGERRYSWRETAERCRRLGSALARRGIGKGDTVAILAPNIPEMIEAHFGVPMTGAVLNALNIRLDAETIAFQLGHGGARLLIADREFSGLIAKALALMTGPRPFVVDIDDTNRLAFVIGAGRQFLEAVEGEQPDGLDDKRVCHADRGKRGDDRQNE